jgi:hypothetical protein
MRSRTNSREASGHRPKTPIEGIDTLTAKSIGWVEAIDKDNTPDLRRPPRSTGKCIGIVYQDTRSDEIVMSLHGDGLLFCGNAILKFAPTKSKNRRTRNTALRPEL